MKNSEAPRPARPETDGRVSRRTFVTGLSALSVAGCSTAGGRRLSREGLPPPGLAAMYGPRPDEKFPVPAVELSEVPSRYLRREVTYQTAEKPGTLIVDTGSRFLYLVEAPCAMALVSAVRASPGRGAEESAGNGNGRSGRRPGR